MGCAETTGAHISRVLTDARQESWGVYAGALSRGNGGSNNIRISSDREDKHRETVKRSGREGINTMSINGLQRQGREREGKMKGERKGWRGTG